MPVNDFEVIRGEFQNTFQIGDSFVIGAAALSIGRYVDPDVVRRAALAYRIALGIRTHVNSKQQCRCCCCGGGGSGIQ